MTWRCYFCDEVFTTSGAAADHFGATPHDKPGCLIDFQVATEEGGKPERGRGLLMALRKAEAELSRYREEDADLHRQIHGMQSAHNTALMREEEKGYARGLRDGVNLPADSPERASIAGVTFPGSTPGVLGTLGQDDQTGCECVNCANGYGRCQNANAIKPVDGVKGDSNG